ncbi:MAG TPA: hypothetical protein VNL16_13505 [Chloroflexota bacterium]|nr:hypothetical protein [Chloroflexota bacterium]
MDLITGIVVVTGAFLIATAIIAHAVARSPWPDNPAGRDAVEQVVHGRSRTTYVALLIGFFIGLADVLVTAQLPVIAFLNVAVGAATVAILFGISQRHRGDGEDWRR